MLAFFAGPFGKWVVIGVLIAAFGAWSWFKGNEHGTAKLTEYIGKEAAQAVRVAGVRAGVTTQIVTRYVKVAGETKIVTQTVEKEVVKYAESNPGYCLDTGWRRLHDAAALNRLPDPAIGTDAALGAPRAAEAIATVSSNYSGCHQTADRLDALQEWVRKQAVVR
jgi:hypothetical protein